MSHVAFPTFHSCPVRSLVLVVFHVWIFTGPKTEEQFANYCFWLLVLLVSEDSSLWVWLFGDVVAAENNTILPIMILYDGYGVLRKCVQRVFGKRRKEMEQAKVFHHETTPQAEEKRWWICESYHWVPASLSGHQTLPLHLDALHVSDFPGDFIEFAFWHSVTLLVGAEGGVNNEASQNFSKTASLPQRHNASLWRLNVADCVCWRIWKEEGGEAGRMWRLKSATVVEKKKDCLYSLYSVNKEEHTHVSDVMSVRDLWWGDRRQEVASGRDLHVKLTVCVRELQRT